MKSLVWFRADLRTHDHPALSAALAANNELIAIYYLTPITWQYHAAAPVKIDFILRNLKYLSKILADYGIPLIIKEVPRYEAIAEDLVQFCQAQAITSLYFNLQYELDEIKRDQAVQTRLAPFNIEIKQFHEQLLIAPGSILSATQEPFKVFTAFKKRWLAFADDFVELSESPMNFKRQAIPLLPSAVPELIPGFSCAAELAALWPAGEEIAVKRLEIFLAERGASYDRGRDFYGLDATSQLSPYLAQGVISIRRVLRSLQAHSATERLSVLINLPGFGTWLNELIWREFYKQLIFLKPGLCCYQDFEANFKHWAFCNDPEHFRAWSSGQTGFPIIDAAMRQLNTIGWMHNRLRMNAAMFLSKLLLLDWRQGEAYFMQKLIDGDLAANNGGWQWCAGTGTDAAPYYRIFNPLLQSEKFDPKGDFIRRYCPELADFDAHAIHAPHERNPSLAEKVAYPRPIIDYRKARVQALSVLKG